jgi:hypothetical protein
LSQVLILQGLNQLQDLRKVSGSHREPVVREAFKDLPKGWARMHDFASVIDLLGTSDDSQLATVRIVAAMKLARRH